MLRMSVHCAETYVHVCCNMHLLDDLATIYTATHFVHALHACHQTLLETMSCNMQWCAKSTVLIHRVRPVMLCACWHFYCLMICPPNEFKRCHICIVRNQWDNAAASRAVSIHCSGYEFEIKHTCILLNTSCTPTSLQTKQIVSTEVAPTIPCLTALTPGEI